jgi:hypothetical protein
MKMKKLTIFRRKGYIASLLTAAVLVGAFGCKKGTFDINNTNPNSPTAVPPNYALAASLSGTANLIFAGNSDFANNWMGYWTQSGGYTPSTTYVEYQLTSNSGSGNWDNAFNNLSNYHAMLANIGANPVYANYRAIGMIMTAFVYQRIVDYYDKAPYTGALVANSKFNYPYTDGGTIYKAITAKIDSAVAIIKANPSAASPGRSDIIFNQAGNADVAVEMALWVKFANTLKLKILMRQTQQSAGGSLGDAGVKAALTGYKTTDFLGAGEDATANPGYSSASNSQLNPMYYEVVADANGAPGYSEKYFRANALAVNFYQAHHDPRDAYFYYPNGQTPPVIKGRVYGSNNGTESNTIISAISAFGKDGSGAYNGPGVSSPIIIAAESLFLQAEAAQRGYITGVPATLYNSAVSEAFRFVGVANYSTAAAAYTAQADPLTNFAVSTNKIRTIITQKWAALNGIDALETYSDYRRLGIPSVGVSVYLGNQAVHIPFRLPYPTSELNYNKANVPDGGTGTESLTSQIFWMPSNASTFR